MRRLLCLMMALVAVSCFVGNAAAADQDEEDVQEGEYGVMVTADIETQYGLGTSNVTIFSAIASKLDYGVHYVYFRSGQYDYCLAYSPDLSLSGTVFSGEDVTVVTYSTSSSYNSQASFSTSFESNFSLSAGSYLVWSDLGDYPTLYDRGEVDYEKLACVILASFGLYYLFHRLWVCICQRYINVG